MRTHIQTYEDIYIGVCGHTGVCGAGLCYLGAEDTQTHKCRSMRTLHSRGEQARERVGESEERERETESV